MINLFKLNKNVSSTQTMIIDSLQKFCQTTLKPRVINDYKNEIVDKSIFTQMGELGIFGPTIKGYGCLENLTKHMD